MGQSARAGLLLLSLAGLGALLLVRDPRRTQELQDWMGDRITRQPRALLRAAEQAMERKDYPAAGRAAREFMASVPLPLPVDAFGEGYRTALRVLRESAEKSGDLPAQLDAGRMAQEFDPRDTAALFDHARALRESGDLAGAAAKFEAAFAIRPFSAPIAGALESVYAATNEPQKATTVHTRHLEAVALCLNLPAWQSGSLVYYDGAGAIATDIRLVLDQPVEMILTFQRPPDGVYLVFKTLAHLRLIFDEARLVDPLRGSVPVGLDPQQAFRRVDDRTVASAFVADASLETPAVIGLALKAKLTPGAKLHLRIRVEPDAELAPWVRQFGTWHHLRVPVAPVAED